MKPPGSIGPASLRPGWRGFGRSDELSRDRPDASVDRNNIGMQYSDHEKPKDAPLKRFAAVFVAVLALDAGAAKAGDEVAFPNSDAIRDWAQRTSWGGFNVQELSYKQLRLLVVIRSHTSGLESAEPFVFLKKGAKWVKIFQAPTCQICSLDITIRDGFLVLQRKNSAFGEEAPREFARLNLGEF